MKKTYRKTYRSEALGAVHETASDLHDAGLMDKRTLRKFDELCLTPFGQCNRAIFAHSVNASA